MQTTHWKRKYMESEHEKRRLERAWKRKAFEMQKQISDLNETAEMLFAQVRKGRYELRSHMRAIQDMKAVLQANGIRMYPIIMSLRLCMAEDHETCPLAMEPINTHALPFEGCCAVLDPLKPDEKCAQLSCGHRFNAVWVLYHFVRNSTFRCPVCRKGRRHFSFDAGTVPECMVARAVAA
jgi:hypothetical protein